MAGQSGQHRQGPALIYVTLSYCPSIAYRAPCICLCVLRLSVRRVTSTNANGLQMRLR